MQKKRATKQASVPAPEQSVAEPEKKKKGHTPPVAALVDSLVVPPKKKRVYKKHVEPVTAEPVTAEPVTAEPVTAEPASVQPNAPVTVQPTEVVSTVAAHKKRGRKPKGGKVIQQLVHESASTNDAPNIILHLKCSVHDIQKLNTSLTESSINPGDVVSFNALETKGADLNESYHCQSENGSNGSNGPNGPNGHNGSNEAVSNFIICSAPNSKKPKAAPDALIATNSYNHLNHDGDYDDNDDDDTGSNDKNLRDIWKKLNHLKLCFHKSDVFQNIGAGTRRSCCFWDTCEFDTPPIYIPRCSASNGGHSVYGCFCSPECALAYLMNEGVDTSVKFERCQMLNAMYGRALNYEKSIKPAPNPQYILNKFYGNLSIQEYRKLFKSEQIIYVVNKPLTHILPEMYEDNNDFLLNNKVIPNNNYKLKKKTSAFG
jgi:hypothetical protein